MIVLLFIGILSVAVGYVRGGRIEGLSRVRLRGAVAIPVLFLVQLFLRRPPPGLELLSPTGMVWLWCGVSLGLVLLCLLNWRVPGMPLIAAGIGLNLLVVALNAGMPVGGLLAASLGVSPSASVVESYGGFHRAVDTETVVAVLGDVIPIIGPGSRRSLVSLGDIILFLGAGVLIEEAMYRARYTSKHAMRSRTRDT